MNKSARVAIFVGFCVFCGYSSIAADAAEQEEIERLVAVIQSDAPLHQRAMACRRLAVVGDGEAAVALGKLLDDAKLATYARTALEQIPDPKADAALRDALERLDGEFLIGVIGSIGKRQDPAAIDSLAKLAHDENRDVAAAAVVALGNIGDEQVKAVLETALAGADDAFRPTVAQACIHFTMKRPDLATTILDRVRHANVPEYIRLAATQQAIVARGSEGLPLLAELLGDEDEARFRIGLQAARELGKPAAETLTAHYEKSPAERQLLVVLALRDIGNRAALPTFAKAVASDDEHVRLAAIEALAGFDDPAATAALLEAATADDGEVAAAARAALTRVEDAAIDARIAVMLESDDVPTLTKAIALAGARRKESATPALLELTKHNDDGVRRGALQALGATVDVKNLPHLIEWVANPSAAGMEEVARESLRSACARLPREACISQIKSAMDGATANSRATLLEQVAAIGGPQALAIVVDAAHGEDETMQDAATRLLGEWMTVDAAPELFHLARSLQGGKYQIRALRGYVRIARQLGMEDAQRVEICRNALELAERPEEVRLISETLARIQTPEAAAAKKEADDRQGKASGFVSLFDGRTLKGWHGDTSIFRVQDRAIVGGNLNERIARNEFLRSDKKYGDFELRLQFKLLGEKPNAGVQIRTQEIEGDHEVSGYQADLGPGYWGCLYDESRRNKILAGPAADRRDAPVRINGWNDYRIRCEGPRIALWINGVPTTVFVEEDAKIPLSGIIALQVHGGPPMEAWYRNIRLKEL